MEKKYGFWERITSDTPTFFKRAQAFGLGLAALGTTLTQIGHIPQNITTAAIAIGGTVAALAQFAVKQCDPEVK